ncbi:hypothetical protein D920_02342 [Enterococcus faecalis 13-SD-W-01]|nr:hypothetical protein D920_02342 [Enterococcus faecalis 13-SD-W-01]
MKNNFLYFLLFLTLGTAGTFLFAPEVKADIADSGTGRSALTIVPLDEDVPRIYEINDLYFGTHQDTETNRKHQAENDLTIRILDARKNPTDWELQLQIESFKEEDGEKLKEAVLNLGKGTFETASTDAATGLTGKTYQEDFDTGEYATVITSTGQKNRGWVVYHIPKEKISLAYGKGNPVGNYQTTSHWRLINANLT